MYIPNLPEPDVPDDEGEPVGPPRKKHKKRFGIAVEHVGLRGKPYYLKMWYERESSRDEAYETTLKRITNGPEWFRKWHKSVEKIER
jgi:hypothetical protein